MSLSSGFHPQVNGQTQTQELEATLRCVASSNSSTWKTYLPCVKHTHDSLTSSATILDSTFETSLGFQPPLFPELNEELAFTSD